jgi:hypothetical protein
MNATHRTVDAIHPSILQHVPSSNVVFLRIAQTDLVKANVLDDSHQIRKKSLTV